MNKNLIYHLSIFLCFLICQINCLYEDQIGKWDWKHSYVGKVKFLHSLSLSKSQTVLVGTESNVVSSINLRNGIIKWRMILEPNTELEAFSIDDDTNGLNLEDHSENSLITINGNGLYVRSWQPISGSINWEKRLPDEMLKEKNEFSKIFYSIDQKNSLIISIKFLSSPNENSPLIIQWTVFNYDKNQIVEQQKQISKDLENLNDLHSCKFVSVNNLICVNSKTASLIQFSLKQESFSSKLINYGFKPQEMNLNKIKIEELGYQKNEENPIFSLYLGNDQDISIIAVQGKTLELKKIFTKIDSVTLKQININNTNKKYLFVLMSQPENLKTEESNKNLHQLKVTAFNIIDWSEMKNLQEQFSINYKNKVLVDKFYIIPFNKIHDKFQYKIIILSKDAALTLVSSQGGKINWTREESLSSIITAEIIDYPLNELDVKIESLDFFELDIYSQFVKRISSQFIQLQSFISSSLIKLNELISTFVVLEQVDKETNDILSLDFAVQSEDNQLIRDSFGFKKLIIVLTKYGKVFGIDTMDSKIVWSYYDEKLDKFIKEFYKTDFNKISMFIQRTTSHYPFQAVGTIVLKNGYILSIDLIKGTMIENKNLNLNLKQVMIMNHLDKDNMKGLVMLDTKNNLHFYPDSVFEEVFLSLKEKYYMMTASTETGLLEGFSFKTVDKQNKKAFKTWSLNIPISKEENNLKIIFKNPLEQVHSLGRVLGDRNVLYKYLNPSLVAVCLEGIDTNSQDVDISGRKPSFINIYLIDSITGQIIYSTVQKRSSNLNVVHTENSLIYSYFNEKVKRTEISAIDLYEGETLANFTAFSSLTRPFFIQPAIIQHATFIFPTGITALADTKTEKGVTNKNILISSPYGGILQMPRVFLDPRRPINPTIEHREEGLMPYMPELPIPAENIINYNQTVINVNKIVTAPATLESTSLTFVFGLDLFYTRVTPSKTFDILKEDFEYWFISGVLLILIIVSYLSKVFSAKKILKNAWK